MANIEQRGTTFRVRVRRHGAPAMTRTFDTLADAELWSAETEAAVKAGTLETHRQRTATLAELLEGYQTKVTWRKKGEAQERSRIGALLRHPISKFSLENLSKQAFRDYRDARLALVSGSTVARELALLSVAMAWARNERDAPCDPAWIDGLKPSENPARERRLEPGEYERLMAAAPSWLQSYVALAVETAMRRGELAMLKWADIDLQRRVAVLQTTKNGQPRRVPLSGVALRTLEAMPRNISGFVFQQNLSAISTAFIACCAKAGIKGLRLHDLRAEAVSRLFERGLDLASVKSISGHKSVAILRYMRAGDVEALAARLA
jgi:integrase